MGDEEEEQGGEEAEQVDEEAEQVDGEEEQVDEVEQGEWVYCAGQTAVACGRTYHTRVVSPPVGSSLDIFPRWHRIGLDV